MCDPLFFLFIIFFKCKDIFHCRIKDFGNIHSSPPMRYSSNICYIYITSMVNCKKKCAK